MCGIQNNALQEPNIQETLTIASLILKTPLEKEEEEEEEEA